MLLRLTNGTTTLTLSGAGSYIGATYFPQSAASDERMTESFPVILEGTESAIRAAVNAVDTLLRGAGQGRERGAVVYVEFRPTDSGEIRRSEVFDGFCNWSQAPAERSLYNTVSTVRVVVTIERLSTWQGPEAELPLSSAVTAERTGGVTVYDDDNGGTPNWCAVAGANVLGTRPAPVRLLITNASGAGLAWRNFHVGVNAYSDPANADLWLLGSEAALGASASWVAGVNHESPEWLFSLSTTLLAQTKGRTFRVLAAFDNLSDTANVRASVGAYIGSVYLASQVGRERVGTRDLIDLGEFSIPPGGYGVVNAAAALVLTVRSSANGSGVLDFVMLMPTDSYRRLEQTGFTAANNTTIVDNGIDGGAYLLSGSSRYPIVRTVGDVLRVHPGRDQRIYILFDEDGNFVPGRQMTVRAYYRPVYDNV